MENSHSFETQRHRGKEKTKLNFSSLCLCVVNFFSRVLEIESLKGCEIGDSMHMHVPQMRRMVLRLCVFIFPLFFATPAIAQHVSKPAEIHSQDFLKLISDLGSDNFAIREKASKELLKRFKDINHGLHECTRI